MSRIGKLVLVFHTRMGQMPGKLQFWWTGPYWITREFNGSYQLGTLAGEIMGKWVNGFRLKPYCGPMPQNPFEQTEADTTVGSRKKVPDSKAEPALPDNDKQVADKREYGEKPGYGPGASG